MKNRKPAKKDLDRWFLYVVRCPGGQLYTGVAIDVARRFAEHCGPGRRGAKFLKGKGPLELVFAVIAGDRAAACRLEAAFKKLDKRAKLEIVSGRKAISSVAGRKEA